jgi:DNA-binding NtrC family response regulator
MSRSERILVVDDERGIRYLLSDALTEVGFDVSVAKDGIESLAQLEAASFDLVVTDIKMPGLDGIEMLKCMKRAGRKEKIIIMTSDISDFRLDDADLPHVGTKLQKPFKVETFLDVVFAAIADDTGSSNVGIPKTASGKGL